LIYLANKEGSSNSARDWGQREPPAEGGGPRPLGRSLGFLKKPRAPFFKKEPRLLKKAWAPRRSRGAWAPGGGPGPLFL